MDNNPYTSPTPFEHNPPTGTAAFTPQSVFRLAIASIGVWRLIEGFMWLFQATFAVLFHGEGMEIWYAARGALEIIIALLAISGRWPFSALVRLFDGNSPDRRYDEMPLLTDEESQRTI